MINNLHMKRMIILLGIVAMVIAANLCFGQEVEGVITYESKTNMHRRLPPEREEMKKMLPEFRTSKEQLFFDASSSLYKPLIEDDPADFDDGGGMRIQMNRPYFEFYLNTDDNTTVVQREFMGKNYLIRDNVKVSPWKFSDETRTIQGYECKQAYYTTQDGKLPITAWFTPAIRPMLSPNSYNTQPGTILALDVNNEEQTYVATKIELRELKKNELKIPKGGDEVTEEQFRATVDEHMKKMGGNGIVIRN